VKRENDIVAACLILLFVSAIVLPMSFIITKGIVNQARSLWFAETQATVLSSKVEVSNNEGPSYAPSISYRFDVDGKTFRNDVISHEVRIFSEQFARDFVAARPPGSRIPIFYSGGSPQSSTATRGITGGGLLMVVFMIPFNIIFLVCIIATWSVFSDNEAPIDRLLKSPTAPEMQIFKMDSSYS
jgi:hypothetical protein